MMASNLGDGVFDNWFFSTKKIIILLDDNNYLRGIKTYKFKHFLNSRIVPPPQLIPNANGVPEENLEFALFEQQDSDLVSWLLSSVSQWVLPHLNGTGTSAQICANLYDSMTTS